MQDNLTPEATPGEAVFEISAEQVKANLKTAMKRTGSTFYWIAGLSLLNTILVLTKTNILMLGGLGISLVVDVVFSQAGARFNPSVLASISP